MSLTETELELDSIRLQQEGPPYPRDNEEELRCQLIVIDEELGSEDLEVLKFLCYDILPSSKLHNADSALSIFENLKKGNRLSHTNVDFLIECLWYMHRKDLIRKLGFDPKEVERFIPGLSGIFPFRKLLLELREDITDKEFETLKFYLDGKVKKKKLQDKKDLLELFVFLEQEGYIGPEDTAPLISLLKTIKRVDLIGLVTEYAGESRKPTPSRIPPLGSLGQGQEAPSQRNVHSVGAQRNTQRNINHVEPRVERNNPVGCGQSSRNVAGPDVSGNRNPPAPVSSGPMAYGNRGPPVHMTAGSNAGEIRGPPDDMIVGSVSGGNTRPPVDRSTSAGTLSAPSSLENAGALEDEPGIIPDQLMRNISQDVKEVSDDFGMELGFTNPVINTFRSKYPDPAERCYSMIKTWQRKKLDQGQVGPGLRYALDKLGFKQTSLAVTQWLSSLNAESQQLPQAAGYQSVPPGNDRLRTTYTVQETPVFHPARPPVPQNNYTSLNEAQIVNQEPANPTPADMGTAALWPENINMEEINQQLHQISMANNQQIPPLTQHPMYNPMIEQPGTIPPEEQGQGQGQGQVILQRVAPQPVQQGTPMEEDAMSMELPTYRMDASPKGICVIINNRNFNVAPNDPGSKEMPERRGTDVDAANLRETFSTLDFHVHMHENLTDVDMMRVLVNIAQNMDHVNYNCFVCCILSHGVLNHLYGTNGRLVAIKDLTAVFQSNRCPSLAGKPKLFFIQACQGREKMGGGEIEQDACPHGSRGRGNLEMDNDKELIPNESDFLVGYATVPGYVSFRSRNHGSWYIRKLCENLEKLSERHDLMSILVKVNEEVSHGNAHVEGGIFKQTPAPMVTLRKKLYFFPRNRRVN